MRINGEMYDLSDSIDLPKNKNHDIEIVIDRLIKKDDIQERLVDSLQTCLKHAEGIAVIDFIEKKSTETQDNSANSDRSKNSSNSDSKVDPKAEKNDESAPKQLVFSENFACPEHGAVMEELSPRLFSFNSPYGACPNCHGLGFLKHFSPDLVIPDPKLPVYAAIAPWSDKDNSYYLSLLHSVGQAYGFEIQTPWSALTDKQRDILMNGSGEEKIWIETDSRYRERRGYERAFDGILGILDRQYRDTTSEQYKQKLEAYQVDYPCEVCSGKRLRPEALSVRMGPYSITDLTSASVADCLGKVRHLTGHGDGSKASPTVEENGTNGVRAIAQGQQPRSAAQLTADLQNPQSLLSSRQQQIGHLALQEIESRLQFLMDVGLDYLTLDRPAATLSGGEAQRIRLATQIGAGLTGVLYVLDEPSIGLHQRDNDRLLTTLTKLRDLGNTLIVVEHDEDTIRAADYLVDIGPGAGIHGGNIVSIGDLDNLLNAEESLTGAYLSGRSAIATPAERRPGKKFGIRLIDAYRNNLNNVDVEIPLGKFVCVTGVSGSGKSTLINELLYPALQHHLGYKVPFPKELCDIKGLVHIDKAIIIDQSPIGRTPRSNPATYTGAFDAIRDIFTKTIEAKARGYKAGRFSFNVKGGRCEAGGGQGVNVIEMNFLPDVYVQCDVCKGARYNRETLQVKYKGYSIADILDMPVAEAVGVFENIPKAEARLQTLVDVGLGYIKLGQTAPTLSGGEAQRVKLATELSKRATGKTIYLIDEPTTGLSFFDVHKLLDVVQRLVDKGNTVLAIEHNLDFIRCADWIIDLGPEGGDRGGEIIITGTPEEVAQHPTSYTGHYLKTALKQHPKQSPTEPKEAGKKGISTRKKAIRK